MDCKGVKIAGPGSCRCKRPRGRNCLCRRSAKETSGIWAKRKVEDETREGMRQRYVWAILNHPWGNCQGHQGLPWQWPMRFLRQNHRLGLPLLGGIWGLSICGCWVTCILLRMFKTENGTSVSGFFVGCFMLTYATKCWSLYIPVLSALVPRSRTCQEPQCFWQPSPSSVVFN